MNKLAGHTFLAKLGKKRLRPGGIKATRFLLDQVELTSTTKILEVGCNMGTSAIELLKKYKDIKIIACDIDEDALNIARSNAFKAGVSNRISFIHSDATDLIFEANTFDVIINEAMLTMLNSTKKDLAIKNYFKILKPGGVLLTHDVLLKTDDERIKKEVIADLSREIMVHVSPLTLIGWQALFIEHGFSDVKSKIGHMSLLSPIGLVRDEGFLGAFKIIRNGLSKQHKDRFKRLFNVFRKHKKQIGYIANASFKI